MSERRGAKSLYETSLCSKVPYEIPRGRTTNRRMTIDELLMSLRSALLNEKNKKNSLIRSAAGGSSVIRQSFTFLETPQGQSFFLD